MAERVEVSQVPIQERLAGIDQTLLSKARPPFAHPRTREFLQAVIAEGVAIIPQDLRDKQEGRIRARQQNLIGAYFSSQATLDDLGKIYRNERTSQSITGEAVRGTIERGMERLWENSPDKIKQAFPWETIPLRKPLTLKSRIKQSLDHGDKVFKLVKDIQQGQDYAQLRSGRSVQDIAYLRSRLRSWGFSGELPYGKLAGEARSRFIDKLEAAQTPQDLRVLFDQIKTTGSGIYGMIERGNLPLTKLRNILSACGFSPLGDRNRHFFIEELEANGVVVGYGEYKIEGGFQAGRIHRYYYIRTKDVPRAEKILRDSTQLARVVKKQH